MLTFSKIGKKGHLGNQLFQLASTIGIAAQHNTNAGFTEWKYQDYFKHSLPLCTNEIADFTHITEKAYEYHQWPIKAHSNYDLEGWLQTEKYFDATQTKYFFTFKDEVVQKLKAKYAAAFKKETILISIRRGDFVNHADYYQTPLQYYLNSLDAFFPDWHTKSLIVLSDDIEYCKFHFSFYSNAYFGEGLNAVEQLCLGSLCNHFIIGNSTFSWWSAWLGEKTNSKIIVPIKNFRGEKAKELNDKDYFPERWTKFNFVAHKINIGATNLVVPSGKNTFATYFKYYFNSETKHTGNTTTITLGKQYIVPPLALYYGLKQQVQTNVFISNTFKVSYKNYWEFETTQDFGFFSRIFTFSKSNTTKKVVTIKPAGVAEQNGGEQQKIETVAGLFTTYGGNKFAVKRWLRNKKVHIKKRVRIFLLGK